MVSMTGDGKQCLSYHLLGVSVCWSRGLCPTFRDKGQYVCPHKRHITTTGQPNILLEQNIAGNEHITDHSHTTGQWTVNWSIYTWHSHAMSTENMTAQCPFPFLSRRKSTLTQVHTYNTSTSTGFHTLLRCNWKVSVYNFPYYSHSSLLYYKGTDHSLAYITGPMSSQAAINRALQELLKQKQEHKWDTTEQQQKIKKKQEKAH